MTAIGFVIIVLVCLVSYLIGSINLSIILSKLLGKGDIRDYGSKNAGTTNTLRVLGKGPALVVIIWDILKGVIAVNLVIWVVEWLGKEHTGIFDVDMIKAFGIMASSFAAILGHNFPAFFGFKGGKGVATSLGVILAIEPKIGLICLIVGIIGICMFKYVSVGSLIAAIEYPVLVCIIGGDSENGLYLKSTPLIKGCYIAFSFILAFMVYFKHRANIERIKNGTENKLSFKKSPEEVIAEQKEEMQMSNDDAKDKNENSSDDVDIKIEPKKDKTK